MTDQRWAIDIDRDTITQARIVEEPRADLPEGAIEVAIDLYAMTANNVTYAVFGKPLGLFGNDQGYWDFFAEREAPGRLPVWGFATVSRSAHPDVAVGTQFYGYYPMASHAVLHPGRVSANGFTDMTPRRTRLPIIYNQYQRVGALGDYRPEHHDYWPVFRPLFLTGWLIADQLEDEGDYAAQQILVASASSKTAIGLGFALKLRTERPAIDRADERGQCRRPRRAGACTTASSAYDQIIAAGREHPQRRSSTWRAMAPSTRTVHSHFGDAASGIDRRRQVALGCQ
jgi:hypothetical protein